MPNLPSGTVTFLFSDIEGSTALLKRLGDDAYASLLTEHRRLVRETFAQHEGQEIDTQGDAFFYSFPRARQAVAAAVAVQRAHAEVAWPEGVEVLVRIGLHTGEPAIGDEGYTGLDVVRAARIAAVGRGGQVLLSETTRALVGDDLPAGVAITALGEQRLKDIDRPEPLHLLTIPGVHSVAAVPPATSAPRGVADALSEMPAWVRNVTGPLASLGDRARESIEQRVLTEIERAMREAEEPLAAKAPARSVADEVARMRDLRDAGALTEEQYRRAVDRLLEDG